MTRNAEVPRGKDAVPAWVAERLQEVRSHLDISGPATGATAARARRAFATWLAVDLAAGDRFDDLVLVVYEAVANAVDHAYRSTIVGPVRLLARRTRRAVHVTVVDHGTWREAPMGGRTAGPGGVNVRGRGLALIRRLVPDVHIEHSTSGTTVHLRAPVPSPS
jgi:anti-sigma regulatory factor (Ser/Thr protein kinase)